MRVSVAMTTYNGSDFIIEQLESLSSQETQPFELIIKDDCSSDDTLEKVERFKTRARFPIKVYRNARNVGYRQNFMEAAALCAGELIAFCDQDDKWSPNKLTACARHFATDDVLMVYHNGSIVNQNGLRTGEMLFNGSSLHGSPWLFINGCTQVIRSSLLNYNSFWDRSIDTVDLDERMAHDMWFYFLAHSLGRVVYDDHDLIDYRRHDRNVSGRSSAGSSWRQRVGAATDRLANIATAANNRSDLLQDLSAHASNKEKASIARSNYSLIAKSYERRYIASQTKGLLARAGLYLKLYSNKQPREFETAGISKLLFLDLLLLAIGSRIGTWSR